MFEEARFDVNSRNYGGKVLMSSHNPCA